MPQVRALLVLVPLLAAGGLACLPGTVAPSPDGRPSPSPSERPGYVPTVEVPAPPARAAAPRRLRRLSNREMENVYADLLTQAGLPFERRLTSGFLPDPTVEGYDNDAVALGVGESSHEQILGAAERVAAALTHPAALARYAPCPPEMAGPACARGLAVHGAGLAWGRRPSEEELGRLEAVYQVGAEGLAGAAAHAAGAALLLEALLASPHFAYRSELGDPAGEAEAAVPLAEDEIASALAFAVTGSRPDGELRAAAQAGRLADPEVRAAEARRLLGGHAGRRQLALFVRSWLGLNDVAMINKDLGTYPAFTPALRRAMERELDTFLDQVLAGGGSLDALVAADFTYPHPELAALYGDDLLDPPGDHTRARLGPRRRGLLSSPAFLATHALVGQTNPVERGLLVRSRLLCQSVPPPPPDVLARPPSDQPQPTTRGRYAAHSEDPACRPCHRLIDPIGFGFEAFDAIGRFRSHEGPVAVDDRGELSGTDVDGPFQGPAQLGQRLAGSAQFRRCFAAQLYRFVIGRALEPADDPEIDFLAWELERADHRAADLLVSLVRRPGFILRARSEDRPAGGGP